MFVRVLECISVYTSLMTAVRAAVVLEAATAVVMIMCLSFTGCVYEIDQLDSSPTMTLSSQ